MPRRNQPEAELQRAVVEYLTLVKPDAFWFHCPNGGQRNRREAAIMAGLGVRAGVPDLVFLSNDGSYGLELKVGRGRLSPAQDRTRQEFERRGIHYGVATSLPEVEHHLRAWGLLRRQE